MRCRREERSPPITSANKRIAALEAELRDVHGKYEDFHKAASHELDSWYKEAKGLHNSLTKYAKDKAAFRMKHSQAVAAKAAIQNELSTLKNEHRKALTRITKGNDKIESLKSKVAQLESTIKGHKRSSKAGSSGRDGSEHQRSEIRVELHRLSPWRHRMNRKWTLGFFRAVGKIYSQVLFPRTLLKCAAVSCRSDFDACIHGYFGVMIYSHNHFRPMTL